METIQNMTAYAKYYKELNWRSRRIDSHKTTLVPDEVSTILQKRLPSNLKDPGNFNITIIVEEIRKKRATLDLRASINLMPYVVYKEMRLSDLKPINMELLLDNRFIRYPLGIVEVVLVQVVKLIILTDLSCWIWKKKALVQNNYLFCSEDHSCQPQTLS
ncbi:hypothetical protein Ddye_009285 [Dipteronia dyeriana]|uniref:Uncharacterized protein n=1 Tax=Dipteronia dyeriana TaxID=168575 RepID=A0AAE0CMR2_9ROSI|nr:hypothetical protein Ddye_009285 [Dipteronia dyeriana]